MFAKVMLNGKVSYVKKSTLIWLFVNFKEKVSPDRLRRFFSNTNTSLYTGQREMQCAVLDSLKIGDWIAVREQKENKAVIVRIIRFEYAESKKRCTLDEVKIKNKPKVFIFGSWFTVKTNGEAENFENSVNKRLSTEKYLTHIDQPFLSEGKIKVNQNSIDFIMGMLPISK